MNAWGDAFEMSYGKMDKKLSWRKARRDGPAFGGMPHNFYSGATRRARHRRSQLRRLWKRV